MSAGPRYDTKLFAYQALSGLPLQVLMYDLYSKMPPTFGAYAAMALVGAGAGAISDKAGMALCASLHGSEAAPGHDYFVGTTPARAHDHVMAYARTQPSAHAATIIRRADAVLAQAPAYTATYHRLRWGSFAAKCTLGALVNFAKTRNVLSAVAYGVTQPAAVIAQDMTRRRA